MRYKTVGSMIKTLVPVSPKKIATLVQFGIENVVSQEVLRGLPGWDDVSDRNLGRVLALVGFIKYTSSKMDADVIYPSDVAHRALAELQGIHGGFVHFVDDEGPVKVVQIKSEKDIAIDFPAASRKIYEVGAEKVVFFSTAFSEESASRTDQLKLSTAEANRTAKMLGFSVVDVLVLTGEKDGPDFLSAQDSGLYCYQK